MRHCLICYRCHLNQKNKITNNNHIKKLLTKKNKKIITIDFLKIQMGDKVLLLLFKMKKNYLIK